MGKVRDLGYYLDKHMLEKLESSHLPLRGEALLSIYSTLYEHCSSILSSNEDVYLLLLLLYCFLHE